MIGAWLEVQDEEPDEFSVLPCNWDAVRLFLALETQWRFAGMSGVPVGIDYQAIEPTARLTDIEPTPGLFEKLRVMERAAVKEASETRRR